MTPHCRALKLTLCVFLLGNAEAFYTNLQTWKPANKNLATRTTPTIFYSNDVEMSNNAMVDSSMVSTTSNVELSGVSMPLVRSICYNQLSLLALSTAAFAGMSMLTSWNIEVFNGAQAFHPAFDLTLHPLQMMEGILAVTPLIGLERLVDGSDDRGAIQSGFVTTNMALSLFGRRKSIEDVEGTTPELMTSLSALIALCTGLSEELLFRAYVPIALYALSHSLPLALFGQAAIFAAVHISPSANPGQNRVIGGHQFMNGLWYGLVYQMTGGDILPCIIAHVLHDMFIFCSSWQTINNQMDYTQEAYKMSLPQHEEAAIAKLQEMTGPMRNKETLNFAKRFFYAFDSTHQGSLSLQDVHRSIEYAFLNQEVSTERDEVDELFDTLVQARSTTELTSDRLGVAEFMCLLFALKSNSPIPILEL